MRHADRFRMSIILFSIIKIIRCVSIKSNDALGLTVWLSLHIVNNIKKKGETMRKRILFKDEEISREIERQIRERLLKEWDKLPSERRLAEDFGVQRDTVRSALEILVKKGVLVRRPRRGYFVAPRRIEINLNHIRSIIKEIERVRNDNRSIMLNFEIISVSKSLAEITQLPAGTLCYQILRIRYDSNRPMSLERSYLVAEHAPDMSREDLEQHSIGSLLRNRYGISLSSVHHRITQVYADDMEAELLRVSKDEPLIRYEGMIYDRKDRLIEYFDNVLMPDNIEFHIRDFA